MQMQQQFSHHRFGRSGNTEHRPSFDEFHPYRQPRTILQTRTINLSKEPSDSLLFQLLICALATFQLQFVSSCSPASNLSETQSINQLKSNCSIWNRFLVGRGVPPLVHRLAIWNHASERFWRIGENQTPLERPTLTRGPRSRSPPRGSGSLRCARDDGTVGARPYARPSTLFSISCAKSVMIALRS